MKLHTIQATTFAGQQRATDEVFDHPDKLSAEEAAELTRAIQHGKVVIISTQVEPMKSADMNPAPSARMGHRTR
jgi:hypothetical protein